MRYGCCTSQVYTRSDKTGIERVKVLAQYGYDYAELPLAEMMALSEAEYADLKQTLLDSGIKCEVCNNFFPGTIRLTGPGMNLDTVTEYYTAALSRAADIGAKTVVFGSGGAKRVPEGFSMDEAWEQVLLITKSLAPVAQEHGITIAIEPIRSKECNLIKTFAEGVRMAEQVDHPNVKVLIDLLHMHDEEEQVSVLCEHGAKWLQHVHFSFPSADYEGDRTFPTDRGEFDYDSFADALHQIDYQGTVSIEAPTVDFEGQANKALELMKELFG